MFTDQEHRADSRGQGVREHDVHSGFWNRVVGRTRSGSLCQRRWFSRQLGKWFFVGAERRQLLHAAHAEHASGMPAGRDHTSRHRYAQRANKAVACSFIVYVFANAPACSRPETPEAAFERTYRTFVHGDLKHSQEDANREYERLRNSSPEWAWKFRILEAKSLLWRGMFQEVLALLRSPTARSDNVDSQIEILAIQGAALARLHDFAEAEQKLGTATQMCQPSLAAACGDVIRARGVLAVQLGQIESAEKFFEQSLEFSRARS